MLEDLHSTIAPKSHFDLAAQLLVAHQAFSFLPPNRRGWCSRITMTQVLILFLKGI